MGLDNPTHIALLLLLLLLVFGAKRLPEMGRSLGAGMRGFKDSLSGESTQPALNPPDQEPAAKAAANAASVPVVTPVVTPLAEPVVAPVEEDGPPSAA
jgi:sec-independent protein translocase protein TatA